MNLLLIQCNTMVNKRFVTGARDYRIRLSQVRVFKCFKMAHPECEEMEQSCNFNSLAMLIGW